MGNWRTYTCLAAALYVFLLSIPLAGRAQSGGGTKIPAATAKKKAGVSPRVSLSPRFVPGESFRYNMEFETTTDTRRSGLASDPQGPSSLVVDWNATVRIDVLPADPPVPAGIRLRTTYEKSTATVRSDTFDPAAEETGKQYHNLEGKVIEFTLDADGNVKSVTGIEGVVDSQNAARSARDWVSQLSASAGAPTGGVFVGQTWSSEQPANSLPIAGLMWRTDSEYLGNESCHPANPDLPPAPGAGKPGGATNSTPGASEDCAVILAQLSLVRSKTAHDQTPPELRKNGVQSEGKWSGTGQGLLYVSLASGFVVSATQTGSEEMNVTLTSSRNNKSMRYAGTIASRSQVELVSGAPATGGDRGPGTP